MSKFNIGDIVYYSGSMLAMELEGIEMKIFGKTGFYRTINRETYEGYECALKYKGSLITLFFYDCDLSLAIDQNEVI